MPDRHQMRAIKRKLMKLGTPCKTCGASTRDSDEENVSITKIDSLESFRYKNLTVKHKICGVFEVQREAIEDAGMIADEIITQIIAGKVCRVCKVQTEDFGELKVFPDDLYTIQNESGHKYLIHKACVT